MQGERQGRIWSIKERARERGLGKRRYAGRLGKAGREGREKENKVYCSELHVCREGRRKRLVHNFNENTNAVV